MAAQACIQHQGKAAAAAKKAEDAAAAAAKKAEQAKKAEEADKVSLCIQSVTECKMLACSTGLQPDTAWACTPGQGNSAAKKAEQVAAAAAKKAEQAKKTEEADKVQRNGVPLPVRV